MSLIKAFVFFGFLIISTASAHASGHCDPVMETVAKALAVRKTQSNTCEEGLKEARELLEVARKQALQCGCKAAANSLSASIEISTSQEYSCLNRSQGLGTLRGGIEDTILCCSGC